MGSEFVSLPKMTNPFAEEKKLQCRDFKYQIELIHAAGKKLIFIKSGKNWVTEDAV